MLILVILDIFRKLQVMNYHEVTRISSIFSSYQMKCCSKTRKVTLWNSDVKLGIYVVTLNFILTLFWLIKYNNPLPVQKLSNLPKCKCSNSQIYFPSLIVDHKVWETFFNQTCKEPKTSYQNIFKFHSKIT